jgi:acyl-CoA thioester hydrolase
MNSASPATKEDFSWTIRVYYEDTDAGGVVFYANYLKFFERARTEWLRAAGIEQSQLLETDGVMFVVKSTALDYHAPSRLDDELKLTVTVESVGRVAVDFIQQAWRLDGATPKLLATGRIKVVCVNAQTFRPQAIPRHVLGRIQPTTNQSIPITVNSTFDCNLSN